MASKIERYIGCLVGLAVGDALGTTLEFKPPGSFQPLTDIVGGGPFGLEPGQWTDDTSMALCLAESLIHCHGFNPEDQMKRYVRWYRDGHLSSTGQCFDIGGATRAALEKYIATGNPFSGSTNEYSAGNGSLMRLAPVALYYANRPALATKYCAESSRTTHAADECLGACRYFGGLIVGAIMGEDKPAILSELCHPVNGYLAAEPLKPRIAEIAAGSFKLKSPPDIKGSGYVVKSLEAALWAFYNTNTFAEGALLAVNLGDDADTTGAVYGQLAGAFYGLEGIPEKWRKVVWEYDTIESLAEGIYNQSQLIANEAFRSI